MSITAVSGYGTAKWIVSATPGYGTHTTIAAALTAASSGDTIFLRPGTYTENLTLKAGVNLTAYQCDAQTQVIVKGKLTATFSGEADMSGISFVTNGDYSIEITGSNATILSFSYCNFNGNDNTILHLNSSNSTATLSFFSCILNTAITGISYHVMTEGTINYLQCVILNSGNSVTAANNSAGDVAFQNCSISGAFSCSGSGHIEVYNSSFVTVANVSLLQINATSNSSFSVNSSFISTQSSPCITIGAGAAFYISNANIESSGTYAISGTGALIFAGLSFVGSVTSTLDPGLTAVGGTLPGLRSTAPSAGYLGENITSVNTGGVGLTSTVAANVTSIVLTAGNWDINGAIEFVPGAATTNNSTVCSISTVSATSGTEGDNAFQGSVAIALTRGGVAMVPGYRLALTAASTTVYLVASAVFSGGTLTAVGRISATRVG